MTKQQLEQLRGLIFELRSLNLSLLKPSPTVQPIFYKDYKSGKGIPKTDAGLDCGEAELNRLESLIAKKKKRQADLIEEMESWIEGVDGAEMRGILRFYYRDGLSQKEIGDKVGYSQQAVAKKLKSFWSFKE